MVKKSVIKEIGAAGRVTELDSGYIDGEMLFEVHSYNGMNKSLNDVGTVSVG